MSVNRKKSVVIGMMFVAATPLLSIAATPAEDQGTAVSSGVPTIAKTAKTTQHHQGEGVIKAIDSDTVTIQHGPITTLGWPAMTMRFKADNPATLATLKPGQRVRFEIHQGTDEQYHVSRITPIK